MHFHSSLEFTVSVFEKKIFSEALNLRVSRAPHPVLKEQTSQRIILRRANKPKAASWHSVALN
jgi:hypothetical protein